MGVAREVNPQKRKLALLNGFDRSGTSFVGGLLSLHPAVNYMFQPFSRTEVHLTHNDIWQVNQVASQTKQFLSGLLQGRIDRDYIAADYWQRYSTSLEIRSDRLNLIKETKWHLKIEWLRYHFPEIQVYGLWRDPRGILCSLVRNNFHVTWYGNAFEEIAKTIRRVAALDAWRPFLTRNLDVVLKMAVIIAVRTEMMCQAILPGHWLVYENIVSDPNQGLKPLLEQESLGAFDFRPFYQDDFNIVGKRFEHADKWKSFFGNQDRATIDAVFAPLSVPETVTP